MTIVEHNDVDINRLFTWGSKYEVVNSENEVQGTIYMRLLGDADMNRARVHALRKQAELRRKLQDPESDEYIIYVKSIDEMEKSDIINYIAVFALREISDKAYKEVTVKKPIAPKASASLKQMGKYQEEVDAWPEKFQTAVAEYMKKEVDKLKTSLESSTKEELYKRYKVSLIEEFCEQEALRAYQDIELYYGCYKDPDYKIRAWETIEEYNSLDSSVKNEFRAAYNRLDVKMEDLKKLRQATQ